MSRGYTMCASKVMVSITFCILTLSIIAGFSTTEPAADAEEAVAVELGALLDAADGAVVTLVAGDTRLVAHRAVLAARSAVFAAMFRDNSLEASSGQVSIPDVDGPVLRQLLAYVYTQQVTNPPDMAPQLLAAADRYGVPSLKAHCEQQVAAQLAVETAAAAAVLAVEHSCGSLRQAALGYMRAHTHQVMASQGWADAVVNHPHTVVEFTRLMAEPSEACSSPTANAGGSCEWSPTEAAAVPLTAACRTPPPDDAIVSRVRRLSAEEKASRLRGAAKQGAVAEVAALLCAGAAVGAVDGDRWTALHFAARYGHLEVARYLLGAGADVGARNRWQNTPLHYAALNGRTSVVRLLLAASADPDVREEDDWTPLHWAAQNGHTEAAAALLEAGASRGAKTNRGATPLDVAKRRNKQQVVELLS